MTWDLVGQVVVLTALTLVVIMCLVISIAAVLDMHNKRRIEMWKAGLTPPGWKPYKDE